MSPLMIQVTFLPLSLVSTATTGDIPWYMTINVILTSRAHTQGILCKCHLQVVHENEEEILVRSYNNVTSVAYLKLYVTVSMGPSELVL